MFVALCFVAVMVALGVLGYQVANGVPLGEIAQALVRAVRWAARMISRMRMPRSERTFRRQHQPMAPLVEPDLRDRYQVAADRIDVADDLIRQLTNRLATEALRQDQEREAQRAFEEELCWGLADGAERSKDKLGLANSPAMQKLFEKLSNL